MLGHQRPWNSPTHGQLSDRQVIDRIQKFIYSEPDLTYSLAIGTDSMPNFANPVFLVTAIVVHQVGHGGIYFWQRKKAGPYPALPHRMRAEADRSMRLARRLLAYHNFRALVHGGLPIHLDIGPNGDTRSVILEVANLVRQQGFVPAIKPHAYVASRVAHKHTAIPKLVLRPGF